MLSRRARLLRSDQVRKSDDAGMTVIELAIASAILMAAITAIFSVLGSLSSADVRGQALVGNEQSVRFMLNDLARDLRGATPVTVWSTKDEYLTKVQFSTGPVGAKQNIRWVYDTNPASPGYQTIRRQVVSDATPSATVVSEATRMTRARNDQRGLAFLSYFNSDGEDMFIDAPATTASDVANCAIRVRLAVAANSDPGPEPFTETLDVHLRARLPGGLGC